MAEILLELQKSGIQIFIATHSYNFSKYLEILRKDQEQVQFHNLYKGTSEMPDTLKKHFPDGNQRADEIYGESAYTLEELQPNHIMMADEMLLDMVYYEKAGGKMTQIYQDENKIYQFDFLQPYGHPICFNNFPCKQSGNIVRCRFYN